jgi:hypothetical protein
VAVAVGRDTHFFDFALYDFRVFALVEVSIHTVVVMAVVGAVFRLTIFPIFDIPHSWKMDAHADLVRLLAVACSDFAFSQSA